MQPEAQNPMNTDISQIRPLQKMFNEVPGRYDLMNRLLTMRLDERWRKKTARICLEGNPDHVLDICTGTGDLACHIARYKDPSIKVTALDFSESMLEEARKKYHKRRLSGAEFIFGDVGELPFDDESIPVLCIGFGFRNLIFQNIKSELYLSEIFRVLKQGGKFVIIETSQPKNKVVKYLYHLYLNLIVNYIGGKLSGYKGAYYYLSHSAIHFLNSNGVELLLKTTGFKSFINKQLFFGVAAITIAVK